MLEVTNEGYSSCTVPLSFVSVWSKQSLAVGGLEWQFQLQNFG